MEEECKNSSRDGVTAFVLCGGLGTRLRSAVSGQPKSMAAVGGVPFLQLLLEQLGQQGVKNVVLGTGYLAEQIEEYFGNGGRFGLDIRYSREAKALGTAGALKLAEGQMSDPALILNGDSYVDWNLTAMRRTYQAKGATTVIALHEVPEVARYGSITLAEDGRLVQFVEKGAKDGPGLINAGVYLVQKKLICDLPAGRAISLEKDIFPQLIARKVFGVLCPGLFIDIGIPSDLLRAQTLLRRGPA